MFSGGRGNKRSGKGTQRAVSRLACSQEMATLRYSYIKDDAVGSYQHSLCREVLVRA